MSAPMETELLAKTIDRAIEQARDLGMPMTVHILMMARIELDQTTHPDNRTPHDARPPLKH